MSQKNTKIESIMNNTWVKSFFVQVNILRKFVPNIFDITKCIIEIMKGNQNFRWSDYDK